MATLIPMAASIATAVGAPATAAAITAAGAGTLGTVLSVGGTAFSVLGAIKGQQGAQAQAAGARTSAAAQANAAKYNAAVATNNAILANRNADLAGQAGEQSVARQQAETRAKVGAIKASQAASGVDINTGSAVDVRSSAAETGQLSALSLRSEAARKAYGYKQLAQDYTSQADLLKYEAKNAIIAGDIESDAYKTSGQTTLLGGLTDAGMGYAKYLDSRNPISVN